MTGDRKEIVRHSSKRSRFQLNEGKLSSFSLTPHDINVISIVARRPNVPKQELLRLVDASAPSKDARDIVSLILGGQVSSSSPGLVQKRIIANNYVFWASHHLSSPWGTVVPVERSRIGGRGVRKIARTAAATKAVAKKSAVKKSVAKKAVVKKAVVKKAVVKKAVVKKAVAKTAVAKKAVAKKAMAKKAVARKAIAKKAVGKKAMAKKAMAKRR